VLKRVLLATGLCLTMAFARADPGYYVVTPYNNEGVRTVDFRYWTFKSRNGPEVTWPEIGFSYGVNSRWTTELFVSYIGSSQMATKPSTLNWQNDYLLTQGDMPFDLALHLQLIRDQSDTSGTAVEFGPVFQTDIGHTQVTTNVFFEHGSGERLRTSGTQMKYQWQLRHRWIPQLHFGLEGFGELGRWNDWSASSAQSHRAGPVVFSRLRFSDTQLIKLQAGYLVGKTYGVSGHMFTMQAAYEF
jgi:hypothetical protein